MVRYTVSNRRPATPTPASQRDLDVRRFIEEVGIISEAQGRTRMEGRIIGFLLVAEPPVQSMDAIATFLGVSKGSVSATTRMLVQTGAIERVGRPADRRDYFRIRTGFIDRLLDEGAQTANRMRVVFDWGSELVGESATPHAALDEAREFCAFVERQFNDLLQHWRTRHPSSRRSPSQDDAAAAQDDIPAAAQDDERQRPGT
jgi:DNA-binding MarR family transcriptional regulator